jgi:hypothetical protein
MHCSFLLGPQLITATRVALLPAPAGCGSCPRDVAEACCVLAGASQVGATGYSHGVLAPDVSGAVGGLRDLADTNGLGQVACGATLDRCTTIGSTIKP